MYSTIKVHGLDGPAHKCVLCNFMPVSGELRLFCADCAYFAPMHMNLTTANDNFPEGFGLEGTGHSLGQNNAPTPLVLSAVSIPINPILATHVSKQPKRQKSRHRKTEGRLPVYALLLLWLIFAAAIARFTGSEEGNLISGENLIIATSGFGLLSLWLASFARRRRAKVSHSVGIAGACVCAVGLAWLYFNQKSIQTSIQASSSVTPELLAMGFIATSLVLAKLWRTPFLLHLSLFMTIGWAGYVFINAQISEFVWLFPALWSVQMFLAINFHIKRTIALSIFTGLFWIGVNLLLLA